MSHGKLNTDFARQPCYQYVLQKNCYEETYYFTMIHLDLVDYHVQFYIVPLRKFALVQFEH
jgi:hypothetical protein